MTGEVLAGRYRLERELGRGGMATVYLATDLRLSRPVAVKRMHSGGDGRRAERFRREAELVASLKHPNVLEVHDYGEDAAQGPYLVCEWVQGQHLRALAESLAPVPVEAALVLAWELARALGAAHARDIVHRDVKPENVLVADGGPLKLADFGIAALADQERLTSTGGITGSLPYMAPERIDTGAFSPASDVYAVGVILFELCAGTLPHAGQGTAQLVAAVMTKDAPSLADVAPGTPAPVVELVARCLARDARERPVGGDALAEALAELLARQVGPPAEMSRSFFLAPAQRSEAWRSARFASLLVEGRALLDRGEGAKAARVLNAAMALRPGSPEVVSLLRGRRGPSRAWGPWKGVALGAGVCVAGVGGWLVASSAHDAALNVSAPASSGRDMASTEAARHPTSKRGSLAPPVPGGDGAAGTTAPSGGVNGTGPLAAAGSSPVTPANSVQTGARDVRGPPPTERVPSGRGAVPESKSSVGTVAVGGVPAAGSVVGSRAQTETAAPVQLASGPAGVQPASGSVAVHATAHDAAPANPAPERSSPSEAPTSEAARATLRVTTRPWAEVFVEGQSRGYTPRVRELSLPPGTHHLRFVNPLCDAVEVSVTLGAGETVAREVVLPVRKAEVLVKARPGARVFVDGEEVGTAPLPAPLRVEHGRHLITARSAGEAPVQREVEGVAGQRTEVVLEGAP
ncbi:protein kinase [Corallococcus sp. M34]|uniref:serine/threonine-protein kinase n=1 Tax=Citreicoccus inhibens TaxID=2849499 RepID=UPI001C220412|nr:serine/threonine-protein kinase [Citreicoccus inhibens]MBU8895902.1 protein kinase [Citreicoccus inhibens]